MSQIFSSDLSCKLILLRIVSALIIVEVIIIILFYFWIQWLEMHFVNNFRVFSGSKMFLLVNKLMCDYKTFMIYLIIILSYDTSLSCYYWRNTVLVYLNYLFQNRNWLNNLLLFALTWFWFRHIRIYIFQLIFEFNFCKSGTLITHINTFL